MHVDHRGSLLGVIDTREPFWREPIVYAYRFTILPGRIKGWGMHEHQADRYLILAGQIRVVLYDGRETSMTYEQINQVHFADEALGLLSIPPGVWHADQNRRDRGGCRQLPDEAVQPRTSGQAATRSSRGRDSLRFRAARRLRGHAATTAGRPASAIATSSSEYS